MTMKTDLTVSRPSRREGEASNVDAVLAEQRRAIGQRVMDRCGAALGAETLAAMTDLVDGLTSGAIAKWFCTVVRRSPTLVSANAASWHWADMGGGSWLRIRTSISCFCSVPERPGFRPGWINPAMYSM